MEHPGRFGSGVLETRDRLLNLPTREHVPGASAPDTGSVETSEFSRLRLDSR